MSTLRVTPLYGSYSHDPTYPSPSPAPTCTLISYANLTILVDVGYDGSLSSSPAPYPPTADALPPTVDAVLVCNSTLSSIGGLPLFFKKNGRAKRQYPPIYSTFPTAKMGQMTLYDAHANASLDGTNLGWDLDDVDAIFSSPQFHNLKYSQSVTLFDRGGAASKADGSGAGVGTPALIVTPHRSGCVVGGCFWVLKRVRDDSEIVVAPTYHHSREKHLDPYELLKFGSAADVLITRPGGPAGALGKLYRPPSSSSGKKQRVVLHPPLVARAEGELIDSIMSALRRGGNVLIPVDASGRVLELVLVLSRFWEKQRLGSAYNLCWVGPMTYNTIEYARSQLEWMAAPLGEQFDSQRGHPYALKSVTIFSSLPPLHNLLTTSKNPTCVLASGATLDNGPSRDLLLKWVDNPDNLILLTDYTHCTLRSIPSSAEDATPDNDAEDDDDVISSASRSDFTTAGQLLLKWCVGKSTGVEMGDVVNVDVLVPHRAPLAGAELKEFLKEEERVNSLKRREEERRAMLREVELARGRLRLGENEEEKDGVAGNVAGGAASSGSGGGNQGGGADGALSTTNATTGGVSKKSKFDSHLFLKFSKPLYMTFEVREEAVGIGQDDSTAKYGVNESVGRTGDVIDDDYGIAVRADKFVDIVTGIDPSKYGGGKLIERGEDGVEFWKKGFGATTGGGGGAHQQQQQSSSSSGAATDGQSTADGGGTGEGKDKMTEKEVYYEQAALEAADLSEGKGIIRGRNGRPHVKVTTVSRRIEVLAEIAYVPLEGRVDARAARQSVRALQPRQVVILGGGSTNSLDESEKEWIRALKRSAKRTMYDDIDEEEEELWGGGGSGTAGGTTANHDDDEDEPEDSDGFKGETRLLADAVRELTVGGKSVFAPSNNETVQLNVGHAAYAARLVDAPYMTRKEKEEGKAVPSLPEPYEVTLGECNVSLLDCVATGQRVAADGSIVLAPCVDERGEKRKRRNVMLSDGDVLLTDLRSEIIAQGMKAEYSAHTGYQRLVVNNKVVVKKDQSTGKIDIEGPLCQDFFTVRSVVCSQYVTL